MNSLRITVNRALGVISILLGIVAICESVRLYPIKVSPMVGDHTLPALIGGLLVIMGALLVFFVKSKEHKVNYPAKSVRNKMVYSMVLMFAYLLLIQYLGYLIGTFLIYIGLFRIFGNYKWLKCVVLSVISTLICYYVFVIWLDMAFPTGIFDI